MTDPEPFDAGVTETPADDFPGPEPGQKCRDPEQLAKIAVAAIWNRFRSGEFFNVKLCREAVEDLLNYRKYVKLNTEDLLRRVGDRAACRMLTPMATGCLTAWICARTTATNLRLESADAAFLTP